jgi:cell division protein FtsB
MMARGWRPSLIVLGVLALLVGAAVLGDTGILHLWRLRAEVEALHRDVQGLEAENERLTRAIAELRTDPAAVERVAREELGLVRPGERVLRFPRSPDSPRSP